MPKINLVMSFDAPAAINLRPDPLLFALRLPAPTMAHGAGGAPDDYPAWLAALEAHWDAVTITATSTAPGTIPHDGTTGSSSALQAWINAQPNGTSATQYRRYDLTPLASGGGGLVLDAGGIDLRGKSFIQLYIPGVGMKNTSSGAEGNTDSFFLTGGSGSDIWIKDDDTGVGDATATLDGMNTATATLAVTFNEHLNACLVRNGSNYVLVDGVKWDRLWGFGPGAFGDGPGSPPQNVLFRNNYVRGGEMGMVMTAGVNVGFRHNYLKDTMITPFDIEPDDAADNVQHVAVVGMTVENYGYCTVNTPYLFTASIVGGHLMDDVFVADWTVSCPLQGPRGTSAGLGGLAMKFYGNATYHGSNLIMRRLSTAYRQTGAGGEHGATMCLDYWTNLEITHCVQPIDAGTFIWDGHPSGTHDITPNTT